MILIDNRNYLRIHNRPFLEKLAALELADHESSVVVEHSKKGTTTLKINVDEKALYMHSKYDPETEAERLIKQLKDMDQYKHILFVGVGLGYHIKALLNIYPEMKFSIYEPNLDVLYEFLSHQNITELPTNQLVKIFSTIDQQQLRSEVNMLNQSVNGQTYIFTLPVYEKIYSTELQIVMETLVKAIKEKKSGLITNVSFQKRWVINSIKNFPYVLKTPNILHDVDKETFEGKPAIIVAAGPSLNEEFENLKYIKENGLAYIFSVGSAINALIEHGIYPDAACTYDPTEKNQFVIQKIKDKNISTIPLIFGSSVGFETLENYPGSMLHMITSQDTISKSLFEKSENINIVLDAPSISVVAYQLLSKLGSNPIILVGQDLGYKNDEKYASGIKYDFVENKLTDEETKKLLTVKDVYGNEIQTIDSFNRMRTQLEMLIAIFQNIEVLNATKGGAHIEGTKFMPLSEIIDNKLKTKDMVREKWFEAQVTYDFVYVKNQLGKMDNYRINCSKTIYDAFNVLKDIDSLIKKNRLNRLDQMFIKFDKMMKNLKKNPFFQAFIEPMVRVQYQLLIEKNQLVRFESNIEKKGNQVVESFGSFLANCHAHYEFAIPYFQELQERIEETSKEMEKR